MASSIELLRMKSGLWLNLQKNVDLWEAENLSRDWRRVRPLPETMLHPEL